MRFLDLITSELRKQKTASPVISELTKRGSGVSFSYPIQFVIDAVVTELKAGGGEVVTLGFKAPHGYNAVSYIAGPFTATKSGTGTATVYTFIVTFATAALDQLLATNLDDAELVPEIKWASTLYNGESLAFAWIVQNNVNRGGESVSNYPVTVVSVDLPTVTRLTGGVLITDLDAQLLTGFPKDSKFSVTTTLADGSLGESRWQMRDGTPETVTDLAAGFILCLDGTKLYRVAG